MSNSFGIVLSGGGTRGAVHAGVVQALQDHSVFPDIISGCSAGSLAGAFFAAGHKGTDILQFFKSTPLFSHPSFALNHPGLFESRKYRVHLEPFFPKDSFESLSIKLQIYSTDLMAGELVEHRSGLLIDHILASCAIPGIFTPVSSNGRLLSDGGIVNVFPVSPIRQLTKHILGVIVANPGIKSKEDIKNTRDVLDRAFTVNIYSKSKHERNLCDWLIDPIEIASFNMISKKHMDQMFEIGYKHAESIIPRIKGVIG